MSIVERAKKMLDIAKPWGSERVLTPSDTPYEAKMLFIEAGQRLSLQFHPNKTENAGARRRRRKIAVAVGHG